MRDIHDLSKEELLKLIIEYDEYIQIANEENAYFSGWMPVCIAEFLNCEHAILEEEGE